MGEIRTIIPQAKLVFGILACNDAIRQQCLERLAAEFGPIDHQSVVEPFTFTDYYNDEMGDSLYRQYLSSERLITVADLPALKHRTNELEVEMSRLDAGRRRRQVNIDPGYLTQAKLVLATTKDYTHRLYIGDGIFAEVTLCYQRPAGFQPFPWSYPDYARSEVCEFFNKVRDTFRNQIHSTHFTPTTPFLA